MSPVVAGLIASLIAGLFTAIGALPVLLMPRITQRTQGMLLGFGGGVMLAATAFSLIVPGTDAAIELGYPKATAALIIVSGILLGGLGPELGACPLSP